MRKVQLGRLRECSSGQLVRADLGVWASNVGLRVGQSFASPSRPSHWDQWSAHCGKSSIIDPKGFCIGREVSAIFYIWFYLSVLKKQLAQYYNYCQEKISLIVMPTLKSLGLAVSKTEMLILRTLLDRVVFLRHLDTIVWLIHLSTMLGGYQTHN